LLARALISKCVLYFIGKNVLAKVEQVEELVLQDLEFVVIVRIE